MAQALRLQLTEATTRETLQANLARDQVRLLRSCIAMALLYLFFNRMGADIDCLTENLIASEENGLRLYHRTRKGQRGVSVERKLLCHLPPTLVHAEEIQMLLFFDTTRHLLSGGKYPTARWAINTNKWKNAISGQLTHSPVGSPASLRQCKNGPRTVSGGPRSPYVKEQQ
jgi:hypothetical protein